MTKARRLCLRAFSSWLGFQLAVAHQNDCTLGTGGIALGHQAAPAWIGMLIVITAASRAAMTLVFLMEITPFLRWK